MRNLDKALAEISAIRSQIASGTEFRGYGPASVAASGILALLVAAVQAYWPARLNHDFLSYATVWVAAAAVSLTLTGIETVLRARRVHSSFANEMVYHAAEQFLPALTAGFLLTAVMMRFAPRGVGMLPGLWQVIFSLGVFASCRFLPRQMFLVGMWYLAAGLICLAFGAAEGTLSPWMMGVPFGIGQLLVAAVLRFGYRETRKYA
ncbi:MAG: hypothetical protein ACLPX1_18295 [Steroidobacteraceae bacterium]